MHLIFQFSHVGIVVWLKFLRIVFRLTSVLALIATHTVLNLYIYDYEIVVKIYIIMHRF